MSGKNVHVVPTLKGGWAVRKEGASKAARVFEHQADAVTFARGEARSGGTELFVHRRDGMVRNRNSYGRDPHPPKG